MAVGASYSADATEFSHKRHAKLKLPCSYCHTDALTKDQAGFPAPSICAGCHRSMEVKPFPSHRVYTVPDFVLFSHGTHDAAGVKCDACHGKVDGTDAGAKEVKMNMTWCVTCHKTSRAAVACTVCHELSQ